MDGYRTFLQGLFSYRINRAVLGWGGSVKCRDFQVRYKHSLSTLEAACPLAWHCPPRSVWFLNLWGVGRSSLRMISLNGSGLE